MKFVVVVPYKYSASKNILDNLEKLNLPKNLEIYKTEKESINNENVDKIIEGDYYIFATRHQSASGTKSLCVHAPGNFNDNSLGGKVKELEISMPSFMKVALNSLEKNKLKDFEVDMEATHHGPYLDKPCLFIEIGSSETEWNDKKAGEVIAKVILDIVNNKKRFKSCIVLGGGHYNKVARKLMLNSEYAVGHVCPKHSLEYLNSGMLNQMIKKNDDKIDLVILDWKGMGKEKQRIVDLLEEMDIKYEKYDKINTKDI